MSGKNPTVNKTDHLLSIATEVVKTLANLMGTELELCKGVTILYGTSTRYSVTGLAVFGEDKQAVDAAVNALYLWAMNNGHLNKKRLWSEAQGPGRHNPGCVRAVLGANPTGTYRGMVHVTCDKI